MNMIKKTVFVALAVSVGFGAVGFRPAPAAAEVDARATFEARRIELKDALRAFTVNMERYRSFQPAIRPLVENNLRTLTNFGARVEAVRDLAQLRALAAEVKLHRRSDEVRGAILQGYLNQLDKGVAIAEQRAMRIEDMLAKLSREGTHVAPQIELLRNARAEISAAKTELAQVKEMIRAHDYERMSEVKSALKSVAHHLVQAFRMYAEIIKQVNNL